MDKILGTLNNDDLRRIVAGTFDVSKVPVERHRGVAAMATHCCLNGPVGTNKRTTFPLIEQETSINGFLGFRVSNNSWKSFCRDVAGELKRQNPDVASSSQQFQVAKDLWPLAPSISEYRAGTSVQK
jgi:hypothetical protein